MKIILEEYQVLEALIGLNPLGGSGNMIVQIIYSAAFISCIWTETTYFIVNIDGGIDAAGAVLPPIGGVLPDMLIYMYLLMNQKRYHTLVSGMRNLVSEST